MQNPNQASLPAKPDTFLNIRPDQHLPIGYDHENLQPQQGSGEFSGSQSEGLSCQDNLSSGAYDAIEDHPLGLNDTLLHSGDQKLRNLDGHQNSPRHGPISTMKSPPRKFNTPQKDRRNNPHSTQHYDFSSKKNNKVELTSGELGDHPSTPRLGSQSCSTQLSISYQQSLNAAKTQRDVNSKQKEYDGVAQKLFDDDGDGDVQLPSGKYSSSTKLSNRYPNDIQPKGASSGKLNPGKIDSTTTLSQLNSLSMKPDVQVLNSSSIKPGLPHSRQSSVQISNNSQKLVGNVQGKQPFQPQQQHTLGASFGVSTQTQQLQSQSQPLTQQFGSYVLGDQPRHLQSLTTSQLGFLTSGVGIVSSSTTNNKNKNTNNNINPLQQQQHLQQPLPTHLTPLSFPPTQPQHQQLTQPSPPHTQFLTSTTISITKNSNIGNNNNSSNNNTFTPTPPNQFTFQPFQFGSTNFSPLPPPQITSDPFDAISNDLNKPQQQSQQQPQQQQQQPGHSLAIQIQPSFSNPIQPAPINPSSFHNDDDDDVTSALFHPIDAKQLATMLNKPTFDSSSSEAVFLSADHHSKPNPMGALLSHSANPYELHKTARISSTPDHIPASFPLSPQSYGNELDNYHFPGDNDDHNDHTDLIQAQDYLRNQTTVVDELHFTAAAAQNSPPYQQFDAQNSPQRQLLQQQSDEQQQQEEEEFEEEEYQQYLYEQQQREYQYQLQQEYLFYAIQQLQLSITQQREDPVVKVTFQQKHGRSMIALEFTKDPMRLANFKKLFTRDPKSKKKRKSKQLPFCVVYCGVDRSIRNSLSVLIENNSYFSHLSKVSPLAKLIGKRASLKKLLLKNKNKKVIKDSPQPYVFRPFQFVCNTNTQNGNPSQLPPVKLENKRSTEAKKITKAKVSPTVQIDTVVVDSNQAQSDFFSSINQLGPSFLVPISPSVSVASLTNSTGSQVHEFFNKFKVDLARGAKISSTSSVSSYLTQTQYYLAEDLPMIVPSFIPHNNCIDHGVDAVSLSQWSVHLLNPQHHLLQLFQSQQQLNSNQDLGVFSSSGNQNSTNSHDSMARTVSGTMQTQHTLPTCPSGQIPVINDQFASFGSNLTLAQQLQPQLHYEDGYGNDDDLDGHNEVQLQPLLPPPLPVDPRFAHFQQQQQPFNLAVLDEPNANAPRLSNQGSTNSSNFSAKFGQFTTDPNIPLFQYHNFNNNNNNFNNNFNNHNNNYFGLQPPPPVLTFESPNNSNSNENDLMNISPSTPTSKQKQQTGRPTQFSQSLDANQQLSKYQPIDPKSPTTLSPPAPRPPVNQRNPTISRLAVDFTTDMFEHDSQFTPTTTTTTTTTTPTTAAFRASPSSVQQFPSVSEHGPTTTFGSPQTLCNNTDTNDQSIAKCDDFDPGSDVPGTRVMMIQSESSNQADCAFENRSANFDEPIAPPLLPLNSSRSQGSQGITEKRPKPQQHQQLHQQQHQQQQRWVNNNSNPKHQQDGVQVDPPKITSTNSSGKSSTASSIIFDPSLHPGPSDQVHRFFFNNNNNADTQSLSGSIIGSTSSFIYNHQPQMHAATQPTHAFAYCGPALFAQLQGVDLSFLASPVHTTGDTKQFQSKAVGLEIQPRSSNESNNGLRSPPDSVNNDDDREVQLNNPQSGEFALDTDTLQPLGVGFKGLNTCRNGDATYSQPQPTSMTPTAGMMISTKPSGSPWNPGTLLDDTNTTTNNNIKNTTTNGRSQQHQLPPFIFEILPMPPQLRLQGSRNSLDEGRQSFNEDETQVPFLVALTHNSVGSNGIYNNNNNNNGSDHGSSASMKSFIHSPGFHAPRDPFLFHPQPQSTFVPVFRASQFTPQEPPVQQTPAIFSLMQDVSLSKTHQHDNPAFFAQLPPPKPKSKHSNKANNAANKAKGSNQSQSHKQSNKPSQNRGLASKSGSHSSSSAYNYIQTGKPQEQFSSSQNNIRQENPFDFLHGTAGDQALDSDTAQNLHRQQLLRLQSKAVINGKPTNTNAHTKQTQFVPRPPTPPQSILATPLKFLSQVPIVTFLDTVKDKSKYRDEQILFQLFQKNKIPLDLADAAQVTSHLQDLNADVAYSITVIFSVSPAEHLEWKQQEKKLKQQHKKTLLQKLKKSKQSSKLAPISIPQTDLLNNGSNDDINQSTNNNQPFEFVSSSTPKATENFIFICIEFTQPTTSTTDLERYKMPLVLVFHTFIAPTIEQLQYNPDRENVDQAVQAILKIPSSNPSSHDGSGCSTPPKSAKYLPLQHPTTQQHASAATFHIGSSNGSVSPLQKPHHSFNASSPSRTPSPNQSNHNNHFNNQQHHGPIISFRSNEEQLLLSSQPVYPSTGGFAAQHYNPTASLSQRTTPTKKKPSPPKTASSVTKNGSRTDPFQPISAMDMIINGTILFSPDVNPLRPVDYPPHIPGAVPLEPIVDLTPRSLLRHVQQEEAQQREPSQSPSPSPISLDRNLATDSTSLQFNNIQHHTPHVSVVPLQFNVVSQRPASPASSHSSVGSAKNRNNKHTPAFKPVIPTQPTKQLTPTKSTTKLNDITTNHNLDSIAFPLTSHRKNSTASSSSIQSFNGARNKVSQSQGDTTNSNNNNTARPAIKVPIPQTSLSNRDQSSCSFYNDGITSTTHTNANNNSNHNNPPQSSLSQQSKSIPTISIGSDELMTPVFGSMGSNYVSPTNNPLNNTRPQQPQTLPSNQHSQVPHIYSVHAHNNKCPSNTSALKLSTSFLPSPSSRPTNLPPNQSPLSDSDDPNFSRFDLSNSLNRSSSTASSPGYGIRSTNNDASSVEYLPTIPSNTSQQSQSKPDTQPLKDVLATITPLTDHQNMSTFSDHNAFFSQPTTQFASDGNPHPLHSASTVNNNSSTTNNTSDTSGNAEFRFGFSSPNSSSNICGFNPTDPFTPPQAYKNLHPLGQTDPQTTDPAIDFAACQTYFPQTPPKSTTGVPNPNPFYSTDGTPIIDIHNPPKHLIAMTPIRKHHPGCSVSTDNFAQPHFDEDYHSSSHGTTLTEDSPQRFNPNPMQQPIFDDQNSVYSARSLSQSVETINRYKPHTVANQRINTAAAVRKQQQLLQQRQQQQLFNANAEDENSFHHKVDQNDVFKTPAVLGQPTFTTQSFQASSTENAISPCSFSRFPLPTLLQSNLQIPLGNSNDIYSMEFKKRSPDASLSNGDSNPSLTPDSMRPQPITPRIDNSKRASASEQTEPQQQSQGLFGYFSSAISNAVSGAMKLIELSESDIIDIEVEATGEFQLELDKFYEEQQFMFPSQSSFNRLSFDTLDYPGKESFCLEFQSQVTKGSYKKFDKKVFVDLAYMHYACASDYLHTNYTFSHLDMTNLTKSSHEQQQQNTIILEALSNPTEPPQLKVQTLLPSKLNLNLFAPIDLCTHQQKLYNEYETKNSQFNAKAREFRTLFLAKYGGHDTPATSTAPKSKD